ncbi:hypothetical protein AB0C29_10655 [Actinoplanes sp. NPDC048791]|uniref:TRADD-N-associated membrane domain-containing protein n=1 Tax=Actinoplanes sp. NPDC048791 TaxID=3154623 RepID=UPI0033C4BCCB
MFQAFGLDALYRILVDHFRARTSSRRPGTIISLVAVAISAAFIVTAVLLADKNGPHPLLIAPPAVIGAAGLITLTAVLGSYASGTISVVRNEDDQLAELAAARIAIEKEIRQTGGGDVYSNLELNLNQITEYYTINKSHARNSFRIGASAVVLGFMAILSGIGLLYYGDNDNPTLAVPLIAGVAGLLGQFVGAYCFYLYNQASRQVTTFYGRLSQVQDTMLAVKLCEVMTDVEQRTAVTVQIISALISRSGYSMHTTTSDAASTKEPGSTTEAPNSNA